MMAEVINPIIPGSRNNREKYRNVDKCSLLMAIPGLFGVWHAENNFAVTMRRQAVIRLRRSRPADPSCQPACGDSSGSSDAIRSQGPGVSGSRDQTPGIMPVQGQYR